eukprot:3432013-Rhodomonas_salina.1
MTGHVQPINHVTLRPPPPFHAVHRSVACVCGVAAVPMEVLPWYYRGSRVCTAMEVLPWYYRGSRVCTAVGWASVLRLFCWRVAPVLAGDG